MTLTPSAAPTPLGSGLRARRAAERFHTRLDWLDSRHSFSFGAHQDPAWMGFGPLRVINEDVIAAGSGFGTHPHRDMEIVTVMVAGELSHRDSIGHCEPLRAGEVQRMSAGTGIRHSEINEGEIPCHLLQIWILPEQAGGESGYEQRPFAIGPDWTLLVSRDGADGSLRIGRDVRLWRASLRAGDERSLPLDPSRAGWLQLISGAITLGEAGAGGPSQPQAARQVGGLSLAAGDGLGFEAGRIRSLRAGSEGADLLVFELA